MSTKNDKFVKLAERRTKMALKFIDLIGNLANKNNYDYTSEQVDKIFEALERALSQSRSRFRVDNVRDFNL